MERKVNISGAVLAGGRSSRMGFSKPFLTVKGGMIINRTLEILQSFFDEILIVTDDKSHFTPLRQVVAGIQRFAGIRVVEDLAKEKGPLGGIYTGLKLSSKQGVFFVACDMPLLNEGIIGRLLETGKKSEADCIIPYTEQGVEPLHGIYFKSALSKLADWLRGEDFSISRFLEQCNCQYIKAEADEITSFLNLNTPRDLEELEKSGYGD